MSPLAEKLTKAAQLVVLTGFCAIFAAGCGTTRWSDTTRTGTEQLLISSAIDSAVDRIDFSPLSDKHVFLETKAIESITDQRYLTMSLRQHLAAHGGLICDERDKADYVVEVRAGAVGTDRDEMLIGIPAFTLPSLPGASVSGTIPEIPFIKRTKQRGVAKLAVFAYNKHTGRPVWASGNNQSESTTNNLWFAGTGPLTKGNIYTAPTFAGHSVPSFPWSKNRKQSTFADQVTVFDEKPGRRHLVDPLPGDSKNDGVKWVAESEKPDNNRLTMQPSAQPAQPALPYAVPYLLSPPQPSSGTPSLPSSPQIGAAPAEANRN